MNWRWRKKLSLVLLISFAVLLVAPLLEAALTKSAVAVDEWAEVAQNAVREGATTVVSACYDAVLHISVALSTTAAHTGSKIEVQISSNTSGDEDWTTLNSFIGPTGTADSEAPTGTEAAGSTVIEVASTLGLYDDNETRWIFMEDNTVANSEMMLLVSHVANTSVTVQDGTTNAHDTSDIMFDIAKNYVIQLPMAANRVRVIYDNTVDVDGSTIHTSSRISKVTGI